MLSYTTKKHNKIMTVCDGCKYQRNDGKCMRPRMAWDLAARNKICFKLKKTVL